MIDLTLWITVSILCVYRLNADHGIKDEWYSYPKWKRVLILPFAPLLYIALAGWEAFEK